MGFPGGNKLDLTLNVQSTGQGHATIFPRLVAERLGIKFEEIRHHHGDSCHEVAGYASVGSRSAMTVGHSMVKTIEAVLAKGKKVAASALEAGEKRHRITRTARCSTWSAPTAASRCSTRPPAPAR